MRILLTKEANCERLTHQTNKPIVSTILTHPTTKQIEPNETKLNWTKLNQDNLKNQNEQNQTNQDKLNQSNQIQT